MELFAEISKIMLNLEPFEQAWTWKSNLTQLQYFSSQSLIVPLSCVFLLILHCTPLKYQLICFTSHNE